MHLIFFNVLNCRDRYGLVVCNCQSLIYFMYSNTLTFVEVLISMGPFCTSLVIFMKKHAGKSFDTKNNEPGINTNLYKAVNIKFSESG